MRNCKTRWMVALLVIVFVVIVWNGFAMMKAGSNPTLRDDVYVYDNAKIMDNEDEDSLNSLLRELDAETPVTLIAISMKTMPGISVQEYADKVFVAFGMTRFVDERHKALMVFSKNENKAVLKTTYGLTEIMEESRVNRVFSRYFDKDASEDYSAAMYGAASSLSAIVSSYYDADVINLRFTSPYEGNPFLELAIIVCVFVASLTGIIVLTKDKKQPVRKRG